MTRAQEINHRFKVIERSMRELYGELGVWPDTSARKIDENTPSCPRAAHSPSNRHARAARN
jgi:hypothetical protein